MKPPRHFFLWDILTHVKRCLWCGGTDVHPSSHPLRLLSVLRYETWRCHRCGRRFPLRPGDAGLPEEFAEAVQRRRPAGEELAALDDTLARLLKPGPLEEAPDAPASAQGALREPASPPRSPRRSRDAS